MDIVQGNQRQAVLIAYLSGIIDGEGCIGLHRNKGIGQFYIRIGVGMTHKKTIELLKETFGGTIKLEKRSKYPNAQLMYRWTLNRKDDVREFLNLVSPYIRVKSRQVKLAYEWLDTKVRSLEHGPVKLSDTEIQRREDMFNKMHEFNAVGAAATTNWDDT